MTIYEIYAVGWSDDETYGFYLHESKAKKLASELKEPISAITGWRVRAIEVDESL